MANSIALSKNYTDMLDEVYKLASLTDDLTSDSSIARAGANANEIMIPKLTMDGLGDYDRNSGYTKGDVTMTYETVKFNYDRGRKFEVDYVDNEETAEVAFGRLAGEFIRTKVAPENDAFTFAQIAGKSGISKVDSGATLSSAADVMAALAAAMDGMDGDEVPAELRYLYITPTLLGYIRDMDTTKSRELMSGFAKVTKVPQSRFMTAIDLLDGKSTGEEAGGYVKHVATYKASTDTSVVSGKTYYTKSGDVYTAVAEPTGNPSTSSYYERTSEAGKDINFLIIHKPAIIKFDKHVASNIIRPEDNQSSDAYMQKYRKYGLVDVYENKVAGVYLHHKA